MKISIIGTGLIGGSIALKLKNTKFTNFVYGIDQNESHLSKALELKIIDEKADLESGMKNSDLIIIAIPVDAARKILPKVLDLINENQTVMDVGSTKSGIVDSIKKSPIFTNNQVLKCFDLIVQGIFKQNKHKTEIISHL